MTESSPRDIGSALRWALESTTDPAEAAANWLANDIDPECPSAIALVTRPNTPLRHLMQAKDVFKTMRVLGETAADRRLGGRLYLAAIAAALVMHGRRISRQSDDALVRALGEMAENNSVSLELQKLARKAMAAINPSNPASLKNGHRHGRPNRSA